MTGQLQDHKVALLIAPEGTEQAEFEKPKQAVEAAGGRACRPTSATPAAPGWTKRSSSIRASSPAATLTTCPPSAPSWWKSSPRAPTPARPVAPERRIGATTGATPLVTRRLRLPSLAQRRHLGPGSAPARFGARPHAPSP